MPLGMTDQDSPKARIPISRAITRRFLPDDFREPPRLNRPAANAARVGKRKFWTKYEYALTAEE